MSKFSNTHCLRSVLLAACLLTAPIAAEANCRQALALALDVSGSVDAAEYRLQLDGIAGALSDPEVRQTLLVMPSAPVRLLVYEWSGPLDYRVLQPWVSVADADTIDTVIARLRSTTRVDMDPGTALGTTMQRGVAFLKQQPDCWKRTLDISGDGKANVGTRPKEMVVRTSFEDVTINGLVIGADAPDIGDIRQVEIAELSAYFRAYVIHGPDAFVETALGFKDYQNAMTRKLLRELDGLVFSQAIPTRADQ